MQRGKAPVDTVVSISQPADEMADRDEYDLEAARILKSQLARHGITYKRLALMLGESYNEKQLGMLINRGAFKFSWFVRVMRLIGTQTVDVSRPRRARGE